jgi:hypothetical protein
MAAAAPLVAYLLGIGCPAALLWLCAALLGCHIAIVALIKPMAALWDFGLIKAKR